MRTFCFIVQISRKPFPSSLGPGDQGCLTHSKCLSTAPKVYITPVSEAQCLQTIVAGMPLLLECKVSTSDAPVQWLKDGDPVPLNSDHLIVQSDDCVRRLLIHSSCPLDTGVYTCDTANDSIDFTVTVDGK